MLKYFLIGWMCVGTGMDKKCLRVASEVTHPNYEECNEYYQWVQNDVAEMDGYVTLLFNCVQAASLEDILYKQET
mgnify:FL=1|tara:strand:+ start:2378 stop:2602 length:225 start_codon:yes stop_codon:yes gene_type:complete